MAKAAGELSMSQPAVSKAISDLEATLGARLFDRTPRGIEATIYGTAMLRRSMAVLDELSQGASELEFLSNPEVGELSFCCGEGMASGIVPVILQRLLAQRPGLIFHVFPSETPNQSYGRLVTERTVELALSRYPDPFQEKDLEAEHVFDDPLVVVAGKTHPVARRRKLSLAQLLDHRWVLMPTDAAVADVMHRLFAESGLPMPRAAIYTMSIHVRYSMLAAGDCISMLPASSLRVSPLRNLMTILPIKLPGPPGPVGIVKLKGRSLSPIAELFAEATREVARDVMGQRR